MRERLVSEIEDTVSGLAARNAIESIASPIRVATPVGRKQDMVITA